MSRPLRVEFPGAWYHVMNRGLNRNLIFSDSEDHVLFLDTLAEACALFNVQVAAYCLMPNHYHALIHTPEGNLSRFMRHLNGVYTQRINRKRKRDGPLFRGRFKGILVQEESYLMQVVKYIHHNPLKARMVSTLREFPWSSHHSFVKPSRKAPPEWLMAQEVLRRFSARRALAISLYKEFMGEEVSREIAKFYSKKYWGPILGDETFVDRIKAKYIESERQLDKEVKGKRNIRGKAKVRQINREVCRYFKIPEPRLYESRRGQNNIPRQMAVLLSRDLSGLRLSELADAYRIKTYKTVGTLCYRFQQSLKKNRKWAKQYAKLNTLCSQEET
jgi:REP-associated tyrosine transposase